jgi:hypothetical protein
MKYKLRIFPIIFLIAQLINSCSNDAMPECFQKAGSTVSYEVELPDFSSINIGEGIELIVKEGPTSIRIETGENIKANITAMVADGELTLRNNSSCNWVRDYNITKVYVSVPNLDRIYSSSQFGVKSDGVLAFPNLTLESGLYSETASGTFELAVDCETLTIQDNLSVYCNISGNVENLAIYYYSGDARFEGSNLIAQKVYVYHRSSNDIIVNPQQEVTGTIYSTGNLVLKNNPPVIAVNQLYTGHLVFQ